MKIYAISDLHLSTVVKKPMDIFGDKWEGHFEKIKQDWNEKVSDNDIVLLGGDMSWGLTLQEAMPDFELLKNLKGHKIVIKGNHDYWWNSVSKVRNALPDFVFIQNDSVKFGNFVIAGARGWTLPTNENCQEQDKKIFERELQRLELSLKNAKSKQNDGDTLIAILHYPPFEANYNDSQVTKLLEIYGVKFVTYGHLHGKNVRVNTQVEKNGITYFLTSCDLIDNKLIQIECFSTLTNNFQEKCNESILNNSTSMQNTKLTTNAPSKATLKNDVQKGDKKTICKNSNQDLKNEICNIKCSEASEKISQLSFFQKMKKFFTSRKKF